MMKPVTTLLLILIFSGSYSLAQDAPGRYDRDSLARVLQQPVADSTKARVSFLLTEEWAGTDTLASKKYAALGKTYSKGNPFWEGVSLLYEAKQIAVAAPDSAAGMFMKAEGRLKKFSSPDALLYRSMCWHDYARVFHFGKDDPETYVKLMLNNAIPLAQQSGDRLYLGKNYLDLAYGFKNLTEFPKAGAYLERAIETLRNEKGNTRYLAAAYHTLSENYSLSGSSAEKAALYLDSMRILLTPYPDAQEWLDYYAGESMRLTVAEKFEQSLAVAEKGIALARQLHQPYPEQRLLLQKFYALYNKRDLVQARDVALDLSGRLPFISNASNRMLLFYGLVATYEDLKDIPQAYKWLKRYNHLSDSLAKSNLEAKVNALEIKFRNAENQRKIIALNAANDKANFALKRTRLLSWSLGLVSILLLTSLLLGYFFYKNRRKAAIQREQIKISHAMLQGQEEERKRVARDLHDSLGGMLASAKVNLAEIAGGDTGSRQELNGVIGQLDVSVNELRRIAHNMMPEMLLRLGLEAALKDLCDTFESEKTEVGFQCLGIAPNIPLSEQVIIYRICQELLGNAVKHAAAEKVLLQCNQRGNRFYITVEDNGVGFDAVALEQTPGMGFLNIRNRVAYLNGKIDIVSGVNKQNTSINIEVYVSSEVQAGHPG